MTDPPPSVPLDEALDAPGSVTQPILPAADNFTLSMSDRELADEPLNDHGNARRLIARHGEDLMYVDEAGWYAWTGMHWTLAGGEAAALKHAHLTAWAIRDEAIALEDDPPSAMPGERTEDHEKRCAERVGKHFRWSIASGNHSRAVAMLASAAPYLRQPAAALDAAAFLITVANGTLELGDDARLRPHFRTDRITRASPVEYDFQAACPRFRDFLDRILPNLEVQTFLQTWFGLCLTADTSEQKMLVFHGMGANGKSTLLNIIAAVLGDYACGAPIETFLHNDRRRGGDATPDLARLPGARLVTASEPDAGSRLSESVVKTITGGDPLVVRRLHRDFFEIVPGFKLIMSCNVKPTIRGQDEGIWRRVHMVPFDIQIPAEQRVPHLDRALIAEESAGILNWMLDGYRLWRERGLVVPEAVRAATEGYRHESDPIGEFVRTCTRRVPNGRVQAKAFYEAYAAWCKEAAVEPVTATFFGRRLGDFGFHKKTQGVVFYEGVELIEDAAPVRDEPPPARPEDYGYEG